MSGANRLTATAAIPARPQFPLTNSDPAKIHAVLWRVTVISPAERPAHER